MQRVTLGLRACLALIVGAGLAACGQKGPLTMPEDAAELSIPADSDSVGTDEQASDETEDNES